MTRAPALLPDSIPAGHLRSPRNLRSLPLAVRAPSHSGSGLGLPLVTSSAVQHRRKQVSPRASRAVASRRPCRTSRLPNAYRGWSAPAAERRARPIRHRYLSASRDSDDVNFRLSVEVRRHDLNGFTRPGDRGRPRAVSNGSRLCSAAQMRH